MLVGAVLQDLLEQFQQKAQLDAADRAWREERAASSEVAQPYIKGT